jgi:chromosome segregation ATPase
MHTFLTPTPIAQSEKMSEQMQTQVKAQSSNPAVVKSKAFKFLESIAVNNSVKENTVYRKILSLRTEKEKLKERRKKVKATIKDKYMQLESLEQQIDNLDIEISRLERLKSNESDPDVDMK